jgi:hypothetical protein
LLDESTVASPQISTAQRAGLLTAVTGEMGPALGLDNAADALTGATLTGVPQAAAVDQVFAVV